MNDVANSTNQIQFCLFASGWKISALATRSLFTFPMNSTLNFPPLTGTHDATRKANLPRAVHLEVRTGRDSRRLGWNGHWITIHFANWNKGSWLNQAIRSTVIPDWTGNKTKWPFGYQDKNTIELSKGIVINYDGEGWKRSCRGLNFFPANLLGSETIDKHLVGVSNQFSVERTCISRFSVWTVHKLK